MGLCVIQVLFLLGRDVLQQTEDFGLIVASNCKHELVTRKTSDMTRALIPVHNQRSLESVRIRLQPPQCISLVLCALNDPPYRARSTKVLHDALQLVCCRRLFCHLELELGSLGLVLRVVGACLVLGSSGNGLGVCLLEDCVCTQGGLAGGLVEEGHDVLHAMLWSYQQWVVEAIDGSFTSPKIRLNMLLMFRGYGFRSRSVVCG